MPASLLTMVFTDLVNSTALKSLLPGVDRDARNQVYVETIQKPHCQRIAADLEGLGGRAVKDTGDGYFLVFADPVGAVRWALGIERSHRERPIATPVGPLQVKIGVHIGAPPQHPHDPNDYVGEEVDFAARLCELAGGGQVLVSESIATLIRDAAPAEVKIHAHGLRDLKGIGRVAVFELFGERERPGLLRQPAISPANLPPPPACFIGREDLLEEVGEHLRAGGVAALKGEGGMGKTVLALKAAHDARTALDLTGGAVWLNCEVKPSLDECFRLMAQVFFGDRLEQEHVDACGKRVLEHLERGDSLLIFDNFETVAHDERLICWLAALRPPARILITTRELPPGLPGSVIAVRELCPLEGRTLFIERANRAGAATAGLEPVIDEICVVVGGQPLAIELLAARAGLVPLQRLLERARNSLDVVNASADPTRPARHRSAKVCIELSFTELTPSATGLLRRTSVFPDGASAAVITAVTGTQDWDEAAEELVAASVWRLAGRRYTMHPLVRKVALDQLGIERAEFDRQAARALAQFVWGRAQQVQKSGADPPVVKGIMDWCEAELRNLIAATDLAFDAQDWESVIRISSAIFNFFQIRGHWGDAEHLYTRALEAAVHMGDRSAQAQAKNYLGLVYRQLGRWADAERAHQDSLTIWREIGDHRGEGNTLKHLGRMLQLRERLGESAAVCEQALALLRESGDAIGEAKALAYLGNVYRFQGRWDEAVHVYERALALSRKVGDPYDEGEVLRHLGQVHHHEQRWDDAKQAYQRSLAVWRAFDDRHNEAVIYDSLGAVLCEEGRWTDAESMLEQALAVFREFHDRRKESGTLLKLARLRAAEGNCAAAIDLGRQSLSTLENTEDAWSLKQAREFVTRLEHRDVDS
jgi:class 3 adenylate cyclase/tetratricopeptide (TPR) repeat protein